MRTKTSPGFPQWEAATNLGHCRKVENHFQYMVSYCHFCLSLQNEFDEMCSGSKPGLSCTPALLTLEPLGV